MNKGKMGDSGITLFRRISMTKARDTKKDVKKKPGKSVKEKRKEKQEKKKQKYEI
jgi:hypothetical protein